MIKGLIALIRSRSAITDLIGSSPMRLYPNVLPQTLSTFPAIAYRVNNNIGHDDFAKASTYDFGYVDLFCYGRKNGKANYEQTVKLWQTLRKELERQKGFYNGIDIRDVRYMSSGMEDHLEDLELDTKQLELRISYTRKP